jgi:hypothetical protein
MPPATRRKCEGGCNHWLTTPESIARKYGKTCAERLGIPTAPPPARRAIRRATTSRGDTAGDAIEGQTEIQLVDHQPSLWSL